MIVSRPVLAFWSLCVASFVVSVPGDVRAGLNQEQKGQYTRIRKESFVALALPPRQGGKLRKEHRRFRKRIDEFLTALGDSEPGHRAAAIFYRAQLSYHYKAWESARQDYEACLALCDSLAGTGARPLGLPPAGSIRFLRAFTFREEGVGKILDELEAIPKEGSEARYADVGERVNRWAEALADSTQTQEAIRAYEVIQKFDLWEAEHENPKRKIDLLKLREGQGAE